jgi:hypothetical protein
LRFEENPFERSVNMPNWTSNRIYIEGDRADIRAFLEAVKREDELFDFNRIIPRPEILDHTGSGHCEIDGKKVESWYIVKSRDSTKPEDTEEVQLFTPEEETELKAMGHRDWYSWSVERWGTKWNACRVEIDDASIECGSIEITFETAWSAPEPVLRKMVEMFPKLTFRCEWRHDDENPYPHSLDECTDDSLAELLTDTAGGANA